MDNTYCSMIHGGLHLSFNKSTQYAQNCCLHGDLKPIDVSMPFWPMVLSASNLREINKQNKWDPRCGNCEKLEKANITSMRQGMNAGLGIEGKYDVSGPARIDLKFDISCNLACRTCSVDSSTYWQIHLKQHGEWNTPVFTPRSKHEIIDALSKLDLSNLRMIVFCGGETLLGQEYWDVANWLVSNVPNAKEQLTLCFQTNGTQTIHERNYKIIEKCHLVKLHISLDGVGPVFEYLRWPAKWEQVTNNILQLRDNVPSNVMFLVEETVSILNLAYLGEVETWISQHFSTNREGDPVDHTKHMAIGIFNLNNCTQEYYDVMSNTQYQDLLPQRFKENDHQIRTMLTQIKKFDNFRAEDFAKTLPKVAEFYTRYL